MRVGGSNNFKRRRNIGWVKAEAIADRKAARERTEAMKPALHDGDESDGYDDEGHHPHDMEDVW